MQCKYIYQVCNLPFIFIYFAESLSFMVPSGPQIHIQGPQYLFKNNYTCEFERSPPPVPHPPFGFSQELQSRSWVCRVCPLGLLRGGSAPGGRGSDVDDGDIPVQGPLRAAVTWLHSMSFVSGPWERQNRAEEVNLRHVQLGALRGPAGFTRGSGTTKEREVEGSHPEVVHTPKIILSTFH